MKKKRMSPYELEEDIFKEVEGRRWATRQNWREVHKEALLLWVEKHKDVDSLIPSSVDTGEIHSPAPTVERLQKLEVSAQPTSMLPVAVDLVAVAPELTKNEQKLERLIRGRAQKQYYLEEAPRELEREPGSLRALNWLKVMPGILASYDSDIEACKADIEAERAAKEKGGETMEGAEV